MSISMQFILRYLAMLICKEGKSKVNKHTLIRQVLYEFSAKNTTVVPEQSCMLDRLSATYEFEHRLPKLSQFQFIGAVLGAISSLTPEQLAQLTAPIATESTNSDHDKE